MSRIEDLGRRAGARLRGEAAAVADTDAQLAALRSTMAGGRHNEARRVLLGVAASLIVIVGIGAIAWQGSRDGGDGVPGGPSMQPVSSDDPSAPTAEARAPTIIELSPTATDVTPEGTGSPSTVDAQPSTSESAPTTITSSPPSSTSDVAEEAAGNAGVRRPVIESSVCASASASQYETPMKVPPPPLHVFGRRVDSPMPIQVFADPELGPTGPFVAAIRYVEPSSPTPEPGTLWEAVDIGGTAGVFTASPDGRLHMVWDLPDGSQVVLRSTGMGRPAILEFARSLVPRDLTAAVPGLDTTSETLVLAAESMNDDVRGAHSYSECQLTNEQGYYVAGSVRGDPVFQYLALIDRAHIPDDVERRGDGIVYVTSREAPALDADVIIEANPDDWLTLRARPHVGWPEAPQHRTVFLDQWEYVELRPVGSASTTPPSPLGLRIRVEDRVAFLEIDYSAVVIDDRAEYTSIDLAPGTGGLATARGGTIGGHRIGPYDGGPLTVSVEVTYTSSAGEDIQTTEAFELSLQL